MANFGTLRSYKFTEDVDDIRGAKLYGRDDDKLGEISDVIFDHDSGDIRYAVVDTGGWFTHKEFLVPADQINVRGDEGNTNDMDYRVNLSKHEIEGFPKYNAEDVNDSARFGEYENRYRDQAGKYFASSNVLHRGDSANVITPPGMPATGREDLPPIDTRLKHQFSESTVGAMNTSPTAWGQSAGNNERLSPASDLRLHKPDVDTTNSFEADDALAAADRERKQPASASPSPDLTRDRPFRDAEVGAASRQSDRLEQEHIQRDADEYRQSRSGERIPGEFSNAGSSLSTTEVPGNEPNTSDSELRTAEGDAVFNNADPQSRGFQTGSRGESALGSRVGSRWDRFQSRVRDERSNITRRDRDKDEAA